MMRSATKSDHVASLPPEVWLNIFSHFDYFDLKIAALVSKGFKTLSEHRTFGGVTFRHVAPLAAGANLDPDKVIIHPALERMSYGCTDDIHDATMISYKDDGDFKNSPLIETSAIDEYATMPALKVVKIKVQRAEPFTLENENGVTVRQVLQGFVDFFGRTGRRTLYDVHPWLKDIVNPKYREENRLATYRDFMGDHTVWNGSFDGQELDKDGTLLFHKIFFDS